MPLTTKEGAFHKEMLTGVRQYDNAGKEVAFQNFNYYDDVQADKGYVPFKDDSEKWNTQMTDLTLVSSIL